MRSRLGSAFQAVAVSALTVIVICSSAAEEPGSIAEAVAAAKRGDPVAYGRLFAFGTRCDIDPALMGSAGATVAAVGLRSGSLLNLDDFRAKSDIGLRQGNEPSRATIDCATTRRALVELAGPNWQAGTVAPANDSHAKLIAKHTCAFDAEDPAALMMAAFLNEKNGTDSLALGVERNVRRSRLADTFITARYLDRYRIVPGTISLNTIGSQPEALICVRNRNGVRQAVTAIANRENGWTSVMQYGLAYEKGRIFILPSRPPVAMAVPPYAEAHQPTTSVDPMSEIDRYPDLARSNSAKEHRTPR